MDSRVDCGGGGGSGVVKSSERTADREPESPAQIWETYDRFEGFIRQIVDCEAESNILSEIAMYDEINAMVAWER